MSIWTNILENAASLIISVGGGASIVWAMSSWLSKIWATRILEKESNQYKERLEKLIKVLEHKNHVNQVRFDAEFEIYKDLCEITGRTINATYWLFPDGIDRIPEDSCKKTELFQKRFKLANDAVQKLGKYSAFIPEDIYNLFKDLYHDCFLQIKTDESYIIHNPPSDPPVEIYQKTSTIMDSYATLQRKLREYLKSLEVELAE